MEDQSAYFSFKFAFQINIFLIFKALFILIVFEGQSELFHPRVCSSNAHNGQVWNRLNPGDQNSTQISQVHGPSPAAS